MGLEEESSRLVWASAAQGDILAFSEVHFLEGPSGPPEKYLPEVGIALMSQTCDLVRGRPEDRVLIAPVRHALDAAEWSAIKRGQKPLLVLVGENLDLVAEVDRMVSVPRSRLGDTQVIDRTCTKQSGKDAALLAARIARALSRFAFPDLVHQALRRLQKKIQLGYGKTTFFAQTLEVIDEFRVASAGWENPASDLTLYAIIGAEALPDAASAPRGWVWQPSTVAGLKPSEHPDHIKLERVSELIVINIDARNDAALVHLWQKWQELLQVECLGPDSSDSASVELVVVSGDDLRYSEFVSTQPLDFSTLSLLAGAGEK
ncbi:hypothetical protein RN607_14345 [Demequina capsici]|uniref:Uncharacterized protein n=1 Tax=Demequina capsici TaxID=3075620 RepID=A0AA96JAF0_9MICO|nr:hypothetical protein [Demequina sp. PMTSA13]WNM27360.1 hypothetical protein RN607_14345 [Demequina sp. PMTSA13]